MTESGSTVPPPEATFESLEAELKAVTAQLEDPAVPLEKRLRLHADAVSTQRRLEAIVEAARKATSETADCIGNDVGKDAGKDAGAPGPRAGEGVPEPYEVVRDRLAEVVNALESEDLPLARVIGLHREAQRLAARCEAILGAAQEQINQTTPTSGAPSGADRGAAPPAASQAGEDPDSDAPF